MPATVDERRRLAPGTRAHNKPDRRGKLDLRRIRPGTIARLVLVAGAVAACIWAIHRYGRHYTFFDMKIYHGAMVWWTHGGELYDFVAPQTNLGFTYPPFAALVMAPMAVLPAMAAGWVNTAISLAALTVVLSWLLVPVADRHGWPRWFVVALAVPLASATEPVRETLGFGQINLLLAVLIYADFVALRNRASLLTRAAADPPGAVGLAGVLRRTWNSGVLAGVGVGLATAIKLTPGLFLLYFVVTKQWRAALTSALTSIGVTLATFAIAGRAATVYFTSVLWDTSRVGEVDATANQSLAGVLARLYDSTTTPTLMWLSFAMLLLAVGLIRAANAHNDGDEMAAFTLVGLTANAICPISWSHHLVFLIPALVILVDAAMRRRSAVHALAAARGMWALGPEGIPALAGVRQAVAALGVYLLFVRSPIWTYEHKLPLTSHYKDGLFGALAENSLGLAIIALVVLLPWRPGADPAFYAEPALARRRAALVNPPAHR